MFPITKSGLFVNGDSSTINEFKKLSTLKHIDPYTKYEKSIILHRPYRGGIIVPRFLCQMYHNTISQIREGSDVNFVYVAKLDDYQKEIYDYLKIHIYNNKIAERGAAGCIIAMGAGTGKTYMAAKIMSRIKKKTAYIVHTCSMVKQAADDLVAALTVNGKPPSIGYYYSGRKIDGDVIILVSKSAANSTFKWKESLMSAVDFYNQFGLIVFDECQLYNNTTGIKMYRAAQAPYMLGLSATPDECPPFDRIAELNIGSILYPDNIVSLKPIVYNITVNRIDYLPPKKYRCPELTKDGAVAYMATVTKISKDPHRNQLIINCIKDAMELDAYVYVFSDRRQHLMALWEMVKEQIKDQSDSICVMGGSPDEDMGQAVNKSRIILTTYKYMGTGRSIRKMTAVIFATGAASHLKQYIGRIHRRGSDPGIIRYIWDIRDRACGLGKQASLRNEYYTEHHIDKKFKLIDECRISYKDIVLYETPVAENDVWG